MTDREALIAGIAADPDNDLRRLVFADWLDEHGEPERAEFVRLQVESLRIEDREERLVAIARANELFREHGQGWFAPFLTALDRPARRASTGWMPATTTGKPTSMGTGGKGRRRLRGNGTRRNGRSSPACPSNVVSPLK